MKNKKILFGIILLFVITGICNIQNTSADSFVDTIYIPALSYAGFNMEYLEFGDTILINEISSDGTISVYIMKEWAFEEYQDSGLIYYQKKWENIISLSGWIYDITGSGDIYYLILVNNALLTGRNVYVDISVAYRQPAYTPTQDWTFFAWLSALAIPAIISIVIIVIALKKHKRKKLTELIAQEVKKQEAPKIIYCSECGADILDKTRVFCSKCGAKIIN